MLTVENMEDIFNVFDKAECINIYTAGDIKTYLKGSEEYSGIVGRWEKMIDGAHDMPAFGVSLNDHTLEAMKSGRWIEFDFKKKLEHGGMPYEKLLVQVESVYTGFNLIRYNKKGGYDGRCFYFDLVGKDMGELCDYLAIIGQK